MPDAIIGAVLGPKAKTLVEIQQLSGCKIEVHKRGQVSTSPGCRLIRSILYSNVFLQMPSQLSVNASIFIMIRTGPKN